MFKAYKYRIYPTQQQVELIEKTFGCCRFVYNLALETKIEAYKRGVKLSAIDLCYQLVELKKDYHWLNEVDSQALQASIKKIDSAYKSFFRGGGFPRFKKKNGHQSFQCPANTRKVNFETKTLSVPKISNIKAAISRKFEGTIKTVTISKTPTGKYFASVLVETADSVLVKHEINPETTLGIDLGLKDFLITSDGTRVANPRYLKQNIDRLKVLQRRTSKKIKGSNNRNKSNKKVAIQYEKITNQRNDFLQKLSTQIIRENQAVCVESLAVKNLVKNHKLAQAISDVSWSEFIRQLQYKSDWYGKHLIKIDRFYPSSKTCSDCGLINDELKLSDREWLCKCGANHDRDVNAAINIKNSGLGKPGEPVELPTVVGAKKQELFRKGERPNRTQ